MSFSSPIPSYPPGSNSYVGLSCCDDIGICSVHLLLHLWRMDFFSSSLWQVLYQVFSNIAIPDSVVICQLAVVGHCIMFWMNRATLQYEDLTYFLVFKWWFGLTTEERTIMNVFMKGIGCTSATISCKRAFHSNLHLCFIKLSKSCERMEWLG